MAVLCIACISSGASMVALSLRGRSKAADVECIGGAFIAVGLVGLGYALGRP